MKGILVVLFFVTIGITAFSQNPIIVDTVITAEGIKKDDIFVKISTWAAQRYTSQQEGIQLSDKEAGVLVCKGTFHHEFGPRGFYAQFYGYIDYTISVKVKDEKYKITVENFTHRTDDPNNPLLSNSFGIVTDSPESGGKWKNRKSFKKYWTDLGSSCVRVSNELITDISNSIAEENTNDW